MSNTLNAKQIAIWETARNIGVITEEYACTPEVVDKIIKDAQVAFDAGVRNAELDKILDLIVDLIDDLEVTPDPVSPAQSSSADIEREMRFKRVLAWLMRNEEVTAEEIERAVDSAVEMGQDEPVCLDGSGMHGEHQALRRAFVNEQVDRLLKPHGD